MQRSSIEAIKMLLKSQRKESLISVVIVLVYLSLTVTNCKRYSASFIVVIRSGSVSAYEAGVIVFQFFIRESMYDWQSATTGNTERNIFFYNMRWVRYKIQTKSGKH